MLISVTSTVQHVRARSLLTRSEFDINITEVARLTLWSVDGVSPHQSITPAMLYACTTIHAESTSHLFGLTSLICFYIPFPLGAVLFHLISCRESAEAANMVDLVPELDKRQEVLQNTV